MADELNKSDKRNSVPPDHCNTLTELDSPEFKNKQTVILSMQRKLAVLTINNPPVNAGSYDVRTGLIAGLNQAIALDAKAVVIQGAGRCFVAGSDLREFGKPLKPPELPDVIRAIENAPFPVIAALHGVALGGGLELALGCDYRIASPDTKLGLPEVSLGFVPGAGGTQRLPRLVGISKAINMICSSARITASEAHNIGLIDAVATGDLLIAAMAYVEAAQRSKRLTLLQPTPKDEPEAIDAAEKAAIRRGKGRPNVAQAIRLIKASYPSVEAALADEREVFQSLRLSDDAFALRYLFFSERRAGSIAGLPLSAARSITRIAVVGGGTMGQGIVRACLASGISVIVVERDKASLQTTLDAITDNLANKVEQKRLTQTDCLSQLEALTGTTELPKLIGCDLVIEAVFEDMAVKKALLGELEIALTPEVIIATNTSYLDINEMIADLDHPQRVLGLHFFSPADVMPLLEIVRAAQTSDATLASGLKLARTLKKQPVVSRVSEGFIGNRIYNAYRRRAELLVLDGASPTDVDQAAKAFGFAMGPFLVSDMSGLDIAWAMRKRQAATRDPKARYVNIADSLCEAGHLGRKTGKGWYDYETKPPQLSPIAGRFINNARIDAEISPATYDSDTIQRQLIAAICNEAALLLEEGVAQRPSDIDVTLSNGYGFPRWHGGPLYWASKQDWSAVKRDLDKLAAAIGHGHREGPVKQTLEQLNTSNEG